MAGLFDWCIKFKVEFSPTLLTIHLKNDKIKSGERANDRKRKKKMKKSPKYTDGQKWNGIEIVSAKQNESSFKFDTTPYYDVEITDENGTRGERLSEGELEGQLRLADQWDWDNDKAK